MRCALLTALLCGVAALASATETATTPADDPRDLAKREAWGFAVLVASVLERDHGSALPGIRAWLADFHRVEATVPAFTTDGRFPALDSEALVTRNPRFWNAYFEVAPGDPGLALLHAALLLCGGEGSRAAVIASLGLQRGGVPAEFKRGLEAVIAGAQAAPMHSLTLVRQGVILHDARLFDAALRKYAEALVEWPANGRAYYERGSTLRMKAIAEAARMRPANHTPEAEEPVSDPAGTGEAFAQARRHDPFCVLAYQGEDPLTLVGMMALVRTAWPIWESMRKRPESLSTREELRDLSEACREAGIDEFALAARQQLVARQRQYQSDDLELIGESARRLAPKATVKETLARVGSDARLAKQIAAPEPVGEVVDPAVGGEALLVAQIAAEQARLAKAAKASAPKASSKTKSKTRKRKRG